MTDQPSQRPPRVPPVGAAARLAASLAAAQAAARGEDPDADPSGQSDPTGAPRGEGPGLAIPPPVPSAALPGDRSRAPRGVDSARRPRTDPPRPRAVPPSGSRQIERIDRPPTPAPTRPRIPDEPATTAAAATAPAPTDPVTPTDEVPPATVPDAEAAPPDDAGSDGGLPLVAGAAALAGVSAAAASEPRPPWLHQLDDTEEPGAVAPTPVLDADPGPDGPGGGEADAAGEPPDDEPGDGSDDDRPAAGRKRGAPVALYVAMALLVLAVPVLAWSGARVLRNSHNGTLLLGTTNANSPGYEALVDPTPTALVVQLDAKGKPSSLTMLSLSGAGQKGGAVVFIPLDLTLKRPTLGVGVLRQTFNYGGVRSLSGATRRELNLSFSDVITVTPATLAAQIAPVAPLTIANPDRVVSPSGKVFDVGQVQLSAADVPQYLNAVAPSENDLNRLSRQQLVWQAWLSAVHASKRTDVVPGEAKAGLGHYVRGLAAGTFDVATLPVDTSTDPTGLTVFTATPGLSQLLLTNAVPFPASGGLGQRPTVRVLNGAGPGPIPQSVLQRIVYAGGQISVIGNYKHFGVRRSSIDYSQVGNGNAATRMAKQLHTPRGVLQPNVGDSISITVILGSDVIDNPPPLLTPAAVTS